MAQSGPIVPCVDCEQYTKRTTPLNGLWYNPGQSGVGLSIELQKNTLFGAYYGYDASGKAVWYTFLGELVKSSPETGIMWTFESQLTEFQNGTCANCEYQAPVATDFTSTIKINFKHKNLASFAINDGEEQSIIPTVFTTASSIDFPEFSTYRIPDLVGLWTFRYAKYEEFATEVLGYSQLLLIDAKIILDNDDGTRIVQFNVVQWAPFELVIIGRIKCKTSIGENGQVIAPECVYESDVTFGSPDNIDIDFNFPLSGLGGQRLFGESVEGHTFEAIRVDLEEYHDK